MVKMMIYAVINMKGGVGKTTTSVNLGAALARLGNTVLLVDLDPQANSTAWIAQEEGDVTVTISDALRDRKRAVAAVSPSIVPGVDLMRGSRDLALVSDELRSSSPMPSTALTRALKQLPAYDFILIDCAPGLGLLSLNAIIAAEALLVPVDSQAMALAGIDQILETIEELTSGDVIPKAPTVKVLVTKYDRRLSIGRGVNENLRTAETPVYATNIRVATKLAEAYAYRQSIFDFAPESTGAADYAALADELAVA